MITGKLPLRVSVPLFPYDRWGGIEPLVDAVAHADRLGYFAVTLPEHRVMPVTDAEPLSVVWYDNFVLAATLAAATSRIRLLFHACVVPYRHPVDLAKLIATLDVVSRGRVLLLAGTGWMRREFAILGIPFEERGPRTDDALRAMRVLWTQPQPSYDGPYFTIPPVHFHPTCVQRPHVPIWVGGNGVAPMRRAVELGDGWVPLGGTFDDAAATIDMLRDRLHAAGRDPSTFTFGFMLPFGAPDPAHRAAAAHHAHGRPLDDVSTASIAETTDLIGRYREAGVNHLVLQFDWQTPSQYVETIDRFAAEVLGPLESPLTAGGST